jgi:hypothetical protein
VRAARGAFRLVAFLATRCAISEPPTVTTAPIIASALLVAGCQARSGPTQNSTAASAATTASTWARRRLPGTYDRELSLQAGDTAVFADGLEVSVVEIQDSRCPAAVRCVWQGEINVTLRVMSQGVFDVHLGSVKDTEQSLDARSFALVAGKVTPDTIGLIVRMTPRDR